jgi:Cu(I)-responsive transcriptional regulator
MANSHSRLGIGELSKVTGIKVVTIRYYEKEGLLPEPARTSGNYRIYTRTHARRLRFIRRCRDLGFTIGQIRNLLDIASDKEQKCAEVDRITAAHLNDVEQKIADLERLADELRRISTSCKADRRIADCRILEALAPDE